MLTAHPLRLVLVCLAWFTTLPAVAGNIDLSTVPNRESVQLTIYNSEDLTLVRETRLVSFKRGLNSLQFSWANTLIDPTSVELRFPGRDHELVVLDTVFPHDRPQTLYWNVESGFDGQSVIEITYFTSGITWSADYVLVADSDEASADIEGFVRIRNASGERYNAAQIRLVVGTVNLVEKIAQLARIPMSQVNRMMVRQKDELRLRAAKVMMEADDANTQAKTIIKEGLSEYFIYTIEGAETIPDGWSKRLRSFQGAAVPMQVRYRYRPAEYGDQLTRFFLLRNDSKSGLGTTPLPDGIVRVFRDNGRDGLSFLATHSIAYVPIGDRLDINLGADPRVEFDLIKLAATRDSVWLKMHGVDVFRALDGGRIGLDVRARVVGWNERALFAQRIRNFSGRDIVLELRRSFAGDVEFRSHLAPSPHNFNTVEITARVASGEVSELLYEVVTRKGRNAKQERVVIKRTEVLRPSYF